MENLWDIDSYQDIIDTTARLAETDPTFYALNEMFTSEENPIDDNTKLSQRLQLSQLNSDEYD